MTLRQGWTGLALAMVLLGAAAGPAAAQVATGTVSGTVKDGQGGMIPGATVTLTNERQGTSLAMILKQDNLVQALSHAIDPPAITQSIGFSR